MMDPKRTTQWPTLVQWRQLYVPSLQHSSMVLIARLHDGHHRSGLPP